jgi:hypothetical protein
MVSTAIERSSRCDVPNDVTPRDADEAQIAVVRL